MIITDEKEFNRYSIAVSDFEKAIEFLDEFKNTTNSYIVIEALLICSVICYYRPFTQNEKKKDSKAKPCLKIESFSNLTDEELVLHDKCKNIRNKALAHSEWTKYPTKIIEGTTKIRGRYYSIFQENIDFCELRNLTEKLLDQCHNRRADFLNEKRL